VRIRASRISILPKSKKKLNAVYAQALRRCLGAVLVGKQMPASKKKNVPSRSQNAGNDMVFHGFLAMKMFGRVGGQCNKSR
jgi:hypothetical protein